MGRSHGRRGRRTRARIPSWQSAPAGRIASAGIATDAAKRQEDENHAVCRRRHVRRSVEVLHLQTRPIPEPGTGSTAPDFGTESFDADGAASRRSRSANSCGLRSSPRRRSSASTNRGPIASSHCSSCSGIRDDRTTARHGQARAQSALEPAQLANRLNFSVPVGLSIGLEQVLKPGLRNRRVRMIP